MKKTISLIGDSIFVTRPIILIPVWGFYFFGYYRSCIASNSNDLVSFPFFTMTFHVLIRFNNPTTILTLLMFTLLMASSFIFNQIQDIKTDAINEGIPIIAKGGYPVKFAIIENSIFTILPLIYAFFSGKLIALFFFMAFMVTVLYNVKPFYFSGRPFLDFLSNGIGFGFIAFGLGWVSAQEGTLLNVKDYSIQALPYFLGMSGGSIASTIPDELGDRKTDKVTTVVFLGKSQANGISLFLLFMSLVISWYNIDIVMITVSLISLPLFLKYQLSGEIKDGILAFQLCGGLMMVCVIFIFPWFLSLTLPVYIGTKLYFKLRHGINYPKMG